MFMSGFRAAKQTPSLKGAPEQNLILLGLQLLHDTLQVTPVASREDAQFKPSHAY